jgi:hypothetical protein
MALKTLMTLSFAALSAAGASAHAATPAVPTEDLVAVQARNLDQVFVRPGADLSAYKKVMVDAGRAALETNWRKDINGQRDPSRWITAADAKEITDVAARSLAPVISDVFKSQGYEIVEAPGPSVLRLSPSVTEIYVNAPYKPTPGSVRTTVRDAGQATLNLDVRDSVSGVLLARIVDQSTAKEIRAPATAAGQLAVNPADSVTNLFWFEALYRQWAGYCVKVIGEGSAATANARL